MRSIPQFAFGIAAIGAVMMFTGATSIVDDHAVAAPSSPAQENAQAQNMACAPRNELVGQLGQQFSENQKAVGTLGDKAIMEVFVSQSGTWTILATDTAGTSCIIAAGKSWDEAGPMAVGQEV
jgi:hypothetical protein